MFSCALKRRGHSSPINSLAFFPFKNPVRLICIILESGFFTSSWLNINSITTSSSNPRISVTRFVIQGFITSKFTLLMSTFFSKHSANFSCFRSFFCLLLNRLSCSALVPWVPLPEGISNWAGAPANSDPELSRKLRDGGGRGSVPAFSLSGRSALFPVLSLARSPGVVPPKLNSPEPFCRQSPQGFPPASPQGLPLRGSARPQDPAARVA